jgi:hypothetical protein
MFRRLFRFAAVPKTLPVRKRPGRARLALEGLEDRCVPAVSASVANGVLTINGDAGDNNILIAEQTQVGQYTVADAGNPVSGSPFTGVVSVVVNTRGGNDQLTFNGDPVNTVGLTGTFTVNTTGALNFQVNDEVNLQGRLKVAHSGVQDLTVGVSGANVRIKEIEIQDAEGNSNVSLSGGALVSGFVSLNMGDGVNTATLSGVRVNGFVSLTGGANNDALSILTSTIAGNVATGVDGGSNQLVIQSSTIDGGVTHGTAGANDTAEVSVGSVLRKNFVVQATGATSGLFVNVLTGATVGGALMVNGGGAAETVTIDTARVLGDVNLSLAGNTGTVNLNAATVAGNLNHSGSGDVVATIQGGSRVGGYVSLNTSGASGSSVNFSGTSSTGGFLSVVSGAGADTINVAGATVGGNFAAALAGGTDGVTLDGASVRGGASISDSGALTVTLQNTAKVGGALSVSAATAAGGVGVTLNNATVAGAATVTAGLGDDTVQALNATVLGVLTANLGAGTTNTVSLTGTSAQALSHQGQATTEQVSATNSRLENYVSLNAGGNAGLSASLINTTVANFISAVGGAGDDSLSLTASSIGKSAGSGVSVAFVPGAGNSSVTAANTRMTGHLSVASSGAGTHAVNLNGVTVEGNVSITTPDLVTPDPLPGDPNHTIVTPSTLTLGFNRVYVGGTFTATSGSGADTASFTGGTFVGAFTLTLNGGVDTVQTNGSVFGGTTKIDTGADNDLVNFERSSASDNTSTVFYGSLTVLAGDDDDVVNLGLDATDLATFYGPATFDGGNGVNTLDQAFALYLGGPPTITNFS